MTEAGSSRQTQVRQSTVASPRVDRAHCQLDAAGRIVIWSPDAEFISGTSRIDAQGKELASFLSEPSAATIRLFLGRSGVHEPLLTFPGFWGDRWLDLSVTAFLGADGTLIGYVVWMQTMADHQVRCVPAECLDESASNDSLQTKSRSDSEEISDRYHVLWNCAADAIFLHAPNGEILDVNHHACVSLGYSRDELIGQMPMIYSARLTENRLEDLRQGLSAGRAFCYETVHRRKSGEEFPVEVKVTRVDYLGQEYTVSSVRDRTETYRERRALLKSEEQLRLALETIKLGTWRYRFGEECGELDRRCQEIMGCNDFLVPKELLVQRIHPDDRAAVRQVIASAFERSDGGSSVGIEHRLLMPDGSIRWISVRALLHCEGDGPNRRPVGLVGTTLDITKPKFAALSLRGQNEIFEAIAIGRPLNRVLEEIVTLIEAQIPDSVCSILLATADEQHLEFSTGNRIPEGLKELCGFLPIGPMVGACGAAAFHRHSIVISDTLDDVRFAAYRHVGTEYGLRSCWSVPIFGSSSEADSSRQQLLGTFAVYRRIPGIPDRTAQLALATGSRLASVAISNHRAIQDSRQADERYSMISQITRSVTFGVTISASGQWNFDWSRPSFGLLSGYSREEVNHVGWRSLVYPEDQGKIDVLIRQVLAGNVGRSEFRYRTKDNQLLYVQAHAKLIRRDARSGSYVIIGGLLDMSEQKAVEQALRRSEERFQLALAGANDGLWDWNLATDEVFYSPRWQMMLGYGPDELKGNVETWKSLLHPEDRDRVMKQVSDFMQQRQSKFEIEYRLRHKDGSYRTILSRGQFACEDQKRPVRLVGTHQDLTDRKQAEVALRRSESFLRQAQQLARLGRWEFDLAQRRFVLCEQTVRHFVLSSPELALSDLRRLIHPADRATVREKLASFRPDDRLEMEFRIQIHDAVRWISVKAAGFIEAESSKHRIWGILQDISDRKQLEDQFRQAQRLEAFGQLAGGVAHDFNNLLTVINGSADMTLEGLCPNDPIYSGVMEIRDAGERAATLTRQLLVLSRQQFTEPAIIDVNQAVSRTESMLRRIIGAHIQLETFLQEPLPPIRIGQGHLDQVLLNLAINARDAMETGGVLRIETRLIKPHEVPTDLQKDCTSSCIRVTVSDTGCGMTDEVRTRIFEPFFSTKGIGKGTGLGLATVYGIVKQSHGAIHVDSHVDCGTSFDLYFPALVTNMKPTLEVVPEKPKQRGHETILLVEDEELVRQLTMRVLSSYGYHVLEAESGENAICWRPAGQSPFTCC